MSWSMLEEKNVGSPPRRSELRYSFKKPQPCERAHGRIEKGGNDINYDAEWSSFVDLALEEDLPLLSSHGKKKQIGIEPIIALSVWRFS